jgi:hypothetical protein
VPQADVLVINDGSVDNTAQEAESAGALVVEHPFNLGIGGAVQTGLKFARDQGYDYVIRLDGDGQHNAEEIQLFLKVLRSGRADLVVGSRFLDADVDWHIPFARRIGINFFGWAVSLLIGMRATDTTSGFCGMNRSATEVLATYLPQDYPDVEGRVIVHKAGLRQVELPVHMRARIAGVSSINSWKSIYYAFKVSLAMITSALKDIHLQSHSPYINGYSAVNGIYQNGAYLNGVSQNGHSANGVTANAVITNGTPVSAMPQNGGALAGAEVAHPSGRATE